MKALEILNNDNIFDESYISENNYQKLIKEAIIELEALKNRCCDNCKYKSSNYDKSITWCINEKVNKSNLHDLIIEDDFYCNKWESK